TVQDAKQLAAYTRDVALDYLAVGLDPNRANLFRQSDVPEVTELAWILSTVTGKGLLDRATSYKDKTAKGVSASMGLFCYPVLMAADILIYRSDLVPVGQDQVQHIEMAQDMAGYFNNTFGREVFKRPEAKLNEAMIVPGIDGQKMSKSYGNTINLFDPPDLVRKRIMSIKTDSTPVESPKDPDRCNVFALYRLMAQPDEVSSLERRYREGDLGYGEAKKLLAQTVDNVLGPARQRREQFAQLETYPLLKSAAEPFRQAIEVQQHRIAELSLAQSMLVLESPINGTVSQILRHPGEVVLAGEPILSIAVQTAFKIVTYATAAQAGNIHEGMEVQLVSESGTRQTLFAEVTQIGPVIEQLPIRLWENPTIPQWGQPVFISVPSKIHLIPGELIWIKGLSGIVSRASDPQILPR
ncbi:MAG: tryptophan--tRNA ligase, partial [Planctomycetes bacterium]|nr:tryptophan--tRNA ligase [Planctomycetota bacterium]